MMAALNEDTLVQQITADYQQVQPGRQHVISMTEPAFNKES